MNEKNYGVHVMTEEEWAEDMKNCSTNAKLNMNVEADIQSYHRKLVEKIGKIPDEDWMKKL